MALLDLASVLWQVTLLALLDLASTQLELKDATASAATFDDAIGRLRFAEEKQVHGAEALREVSFPP